MTANVGVSFRGDRKETALSASVYSGNGMGQHYTDTSHPVVQRTLALAKETQAKDVLDLASGRGITALTLAQEASVQSVMATDINEVGLQEIQHQAKAQTLPVKTRPWSAAGQLPPAWKGKFDLVIAKDLYPFLNPQQVSRFLKNAADALKPGGWFLVSAPSTRSQLFQESTPGSPANPMYRALSENAKRFIQTSRSHFSFTSIERLATRLRQVGLQVTEASHYGRAQGWVMAIAQKPVQASAKHS